MSNPYPFFWSNDLSNEELFKKGYLIISVEIYDLQAHEVIVDFIDEESFKRFQALIGQADNGQEESMLLVEDYTGKRLREGTNYFLSRATIEALNEEQRIANNQDSLFIGYKVSLEDREDYNIFGATESASKQVLAYKGESLERLELPATAQRTSKVIVNNVGQGNWNEIVADNKIFMVYDFGASYFQKRSAVQNILKARDLVNKYAAHKPALVLSHWDIDHYHMLLAAPDELLASFSTIIYKGSTPNSTSERVERRLRECNSNLYPLNSRIPASRKKEDRLPLEVAALTNSIILFNASYHANRNRNAIGLLVRKKRKSVILPGDMHYDQIADMTNEIGIPTVHSLVVPHHGGKAGTVKYTLPLKSKYHKAVVSVGKNPYKHPHEQHIDKLRDKGFSIKKTINLGDVEINI